MSISVTHNRNSAIQVMHDTCAVPWTSATFIIDHLTGDWFTAPIVNSNRVVKFRRIIGTQAIETSTPSDMVATVDRETGIMAMPTRELAMS